MDRIAQEDSLQVVWTASGSALQIHTSEPVDLSRESNGAMELSFRARGVNSRSAFVEIGMGCHDGEDCAHFVPVEITQGPWSEYRSSLGCLADAGVDMTRLDRSFILRTQDEAGEIGLGDIALGADIDAIRTCGTEG